MRKWISVISLSVALAIVIAGCDSVDTTGTDDVMVHPTVSVSFVNAGHSASKDLQGQAIINVELTVTSSAGVDYSPDPVQVDDTSDDQASFELSLPPDSVFSFEARLTRNDELIAEGRVVQLISEESSEVTLPVVVANGEPYFALIPSRLEMGIRAGTMELEMKLYGSKTGIVGLAVKMNRTGNDPADFSVDGVDIVESEGDLTSLAWQFGQGGATLDLGTIEIPVDEAAEFCLDVGADDVRLVNSNGQISLIGGSGACIHVTQ
jgi:hypothetical protein